MTLVIEGAPRTKKTHNRIVRVKGRPIVLPSKANETWSRTAVLQLQAQYRRQSLAAKLAVLKCDPVNVRAVFYRDANRGDLIGYMQALADVLEASGVVENDRLIVSWDGTRMLVDKARPRIEVTIWAALPATGQCRSWDRETGQRCGLPQGHESPFHDTKPEGC